MSKTKRRRRVVPEPASKAATREIPTAYSANSVLVAALLVYVGILATMVAFDSYTFLLKSAVVPFLVVTALLSRRFSTFVNDWAVFLGIVVLFDSLRSVAYAIISHFSLPMYANYVIEWERWLCLGAVAPASAQAWRASLADPGWLDRLFVLLHGSHFLFFLIFGFVIWYLRRDVFRNYVIGMSIVLYLALLIQFIVPTLPPWLAARDFALLPPIERIMNSIYNVQLPSLVAIFDVNPIAAMPSLHTAMPALCALLGLRYLGWFGWPVLLYAIGVWTAIIYLGEHYLVDVVAGILLALLAYFAVGRSRAAPAAAPDGVADAPVQHIRAQPIMLGLLLVACAFGCGQITTAWMAPLPVTRAFVERELIGRSSAAHYLLGRIAFDEGNFAEAKLELSHAMDDLPGAAERNVVRPFLGRSAYEVGDFPTAIAALQPLQATGDVTSLVLLATAYARTDQYEQGIAVLREARQRFPADPAPLYWLARLQFQAGRIDQVAVHATIEALKQFPSANAESFQRSLAEMLRARPG